LSLNVLQACNMSCGYCYADEGRFGGPGRAMQPETARAAVDRLLAESRPGADVVVGFMGGEPLLARDVVHDVTAYATRAAAAADRRVRFAITTNLTTVTPPDARLFAEYPFAVSVSVDGDREQHDAVRRMHGGGASSYQQMIAGLDVLRRHGRPRHLAARVTVTPRTGRLLPVLEHVLGLGFDEVGFTRSTGVATGPTRAAREPATSAQAPTVTCSPATGWSTTPTSRWVRCRPARTTRHGPPTSPAATSTGRRPAGRAGPGTCAAAGATTR